VPKSLIDLHDNFSNFFLKITGQIFRRASKSPGDLTKDDIDDDLERHLKVILGRIISLSIRIFSRTLLALAPSCSNFA